MVYILIFISIVAMTAAQLLVKKGMLSLGQFPHTISEIVPFFLKAYSNVYVISAILVTIVAGFAWLLALSRVQLSFAYPFMALSYTLVALFSLLFFKEDVNILRWSGVIVICIGVFLVSRS